MPSSRSSSKRRAGEIAGPHPAADGGAVPFSTQEEVETTVNSTAEIQKRVAAGQITWAGPLIMLTARSVLVVICQALVAAIFFRGSADAWKEAEK